MRRAFLVLSLSLVAAAGPALAGTVVLKDGTVLTTSKPHVIKGNQAILTLADGTLVSVPARDIDAARTRAANASAAAPRPVATVAVPPQTPAEAARQKNTRKATVVLSDEDVIHPISFGGEDGEGGAAAAAKNAEGRVEVSGVTTSRDGGRVSISGSLQNMGSGEVSGVTLTVEAIGESNATVASDFGRVAKNTLNPGETTTFTAEFPEEGVVNFRFLPRWQVSIPVRAPGDGTDAGAPGMPLDAPPAAPQAAPAATPAPSPAPARNEPAYQPRPDYAPPAANPQVGSSRNPNEGYLPQPSDVIPMPSPPPPPPQQQQSNPK